MYRGQYNIQPPSKNKKNTLRFNPNRMVGPMLPTNPKVPHYQSANRSPRNSTKQQRASLQDTHIPLSEGRKIVKNRTDTHSSDQTSTIPITMIGSLLMQF